MAGDLEFSVRLSADGSAYVGPVRVARQETENLSQAVVNARAAQIQATDAVIQQSKANDELGASLHRTLDRYDPLGAKLRQLTADFDTLNKAMTAGVGTDANTAAVDAAYAKINTQIASTKALMVQAGAAGAEGFGKMEKGGIAAALATAGARRELIVLGHEALTGNFSRIPGSFAVLAERMSATSLLFGPIAIGVGVVAASAIALGLAFVHGAQEVQEMDRALAVTNDYAGQTRTSMRELATSITDAANVTIGTAKSIVTELVSSGRIGSEAINQVAAIAGRLAEATGTDMDKIAAELIKVFDNPLKGAQDLDKQMHFLTITDIEHLKVLGELGDKTEAQLFLAQRLTDALPKQAENVGFLTSAWRTLKGALSEVWDVMQSIGRTNTSGEALAAAKRQLAFLEVSNAPQEAIDAQKKAVDAAQALASSERDVAKAKGEAAAAGDKQKTIWNEITKASKLYAIQAKETELAAVKAFNPENAEQAKIQADAVKNLAEQIAKMRAGPQGRAIDPTAAFIEQIQQQAALEKQTNAAALEDAKQYRDERVAIDKEMYDARMVDEVTYLNAVQVDNEQYAAAAEAIAQKQVDDANRRLGVLTEIQLSQTLTSRQELEIEKAVAAAYLDTQKAAENLNKTRAAGATQAIKDGGNIASAVTKEEQGVAKINADYLKYLDSLKKIDAERNFALSLIGKSTEDILLLTAAHRAELEVDNEVAKLQEQEAALDVVRDAAKIAAIDELIAKVRESRDARVEAAKTSAVAEQAAIDSFATGWQTALNAFNRSLTGASVAQQAFNTLTQSMENLFVGFAQHSTNAFKTFTNALLQMIEQIAAKIAVSGILQLLGLGTGAGAFSFAGAAAGAVPGGGTSLLSNVGSLGSSIAGGASSIFGASSFTAGLAGDAFLPGALGAGGVGAVGLESLGASLAPLMAAAPYAAIAAITLPFIIKAFDKGPANRTATFSSGPASLAPDASRDAAFQGSSAFGTFGISKDKWLSPDDKGAGEAFGKTLTAITTIDNKIADLVGTDQTKLITDALNAHSITVGLGKEHTDINASGGPGAILQDRYTTVVSAIDAGLGQLVAHFQGTGEELANFVVNLVSLHEAVAGGSTILEDAQKQWDATQGVQASSTEKLRLMGDSVRDLSAQFDGSVASAQALAGATLQYKQAATEAILAIKGLQKSLTDMFQATREHVEFAGLDKQSEYDLYKSKGSTLLETISQTNDPEVVSQLSQKINGYFVSAFDLLDPSEQLAHKQEFLDDLNNVDKQTHDRLDTIGGNISDNATDVFKGVNDALTAAGKQFLDAAAKQGDAADKIGAAADKFGGYVDDIVNAPPLGLALEDNRSAVGGNTG